MKKIVFAMMLAVLFIANVNAKEVYYTNGVVELTEREYNYVKEFYGEDYLKAMTIEQYKRLVELDVNNHDYKIKKVVVGDPNQATPFGTYVKTEYKSLGISSVCNSDSCLITVLATWLGSPTIRSWDVMGARLYGTSLTNQNVYTYLGDSNGTTVPSNYRFLSNGFGNSFKLPSGSGISIEQKFTVKRGGSVFASYQHAMSTSTLETSKLYNLTVTGYGSVFSFYGAAVGKYDGMVGVNLDV